MSNAIAASTVPWLFLEKVAMLKQVLYGATLHLDNMIQLPLPAQHSPAIDSLPFTEPKAP